VVSWCVQETRCNSRFECVRVADWARDWMEHENMDRCIFMLWMDWDWELTLRSAELTNIWTVLSKKNEYMDRDSKPLSKAVGTGSGN
jgi:hypothetical protein